MDRRYFMAGSAAVGGLMMTRGAQAKRQTTRLAMLAGAPRLQVRNLPNNARPPVLYVHGATFPSALSVGYRFADGMSWEDALHRDGFDPWALDFEGFGGSDRPAVFAKAPDSGAIPLRAMDAAQQIARAVQHVIDKTGANSVSIISHSWGTIPAARFACDHPGRVNALVLFAPVLPRTPTGAKPGNNLPSGGAVPAWRALTVAEQLARFINDTPKAHPSVLAEPTLDRWGPTWLATDPGSATRTPPAVQVPTGPQADILGTWQGADYYDPALLKMRTMLVRGEWDSVSSAADADRFQTRIKAPYSTAVIPASGHLAHIETNRALLWANVSAFLKARSS